MHRGELANDISGFENESSLELRVCVPACVWTSSHFFFFLFFFFTFLNGSTTCELPRLCVSSLLFSFPTFRWQPLPFILSKRGFHTSRGLDSHSLPDVGHALECSCRRRAHTRGAERAGTGIPACSAVSQHTVWV